MENMPVAARNALDGERWVASSVNTAMETETAPCVGV